MNERCISRISLTNTRSIYGRIVICGSFSVVNLRINCLNLQQVLTGFDDVISAVASGVRKIDGYFAVNTLFLIK